MSNVGGKLERGFVATFYTEIPKVEGEKGKRGGKGKVENIVSFGHADFPAFVAMLAHRYGFKACPDLLRNPKLSAETMWAGTMYSSTGVLYEAYIAASNEAKFVPDPLFDSAE